MVERLAERSHLSIGEVLSLLRDEFPDVTISKIRFLESQGLVDPERTPSGYRKFYEQDVERLRWILRQQREHYMPLKVIRSRLSAQPDGSPADQEAAVPQEARTPVAVVEAELTVTSLTETAVELEPEPVPDPEPVAATPAQRAATPSLFAGLYDRTTEEQSAPEVGPADEPTPEPPSPPSAQARERRPPARPEPVRNPAAGAANAEPDTYTAEELAEAAGAELNLVGELKQYGLITPHAAMAGTQYYDDAALAVTKAAAEFARHGVEARHLRIWKNAADRESDLMQQVVLPLLRQRNPQARRQALDTLADLSRAGADLRAALVERAVRDIR